MIQFTYETNFELSNEKSISQWITDCIESYEYKEGDIHYIFCDDDYLHKLNVEFLNHDTLTDIISFDYTMGKLISGDIFISIERVKENATNYSDSFQEELHRVIIHGILHYIGYRDSLEEERNEMRKQEEICLKKLKNL